MQVNPNANDHGKRTDVVARRPGRQPARAGLCQSHATAGKKAKVRELLAMIQVVQDPRWWQSEESWFLELEEYG